MTVDATASHRPPLTLDDLVDLLDERADRCDVTVGVSFIVNGETVLLYPRDAVLSVHHHGLVEITLTLDENF